MNEANTHEKASSLRHNALVAVAQSAVWAYQTTQVSKDRFNFCEKAIQAAESLIAEFPTKGSGYYWKGIFISLRSEEKDRENGIDIGSLSLQIPLNVMRSEKEIVPLFRKALKLEPEVDGYGPNRVLGFMNLLKTEIGSFAGGDIKIATQNLELAYKKAPHYSVNVLYYARLLKELEREDEARKILKDLIAKDPYTFNPDRVADTKKDQKEAEKLLKDL